MLVIEYSLIVTISVSTDISIYNGIPHRNFTNRRKSGALDVSCITIGPDVLGSFWISGGPGSQNGY